MKPITYTQSEWNDIWERIKKDYPPSVWLIRSKMREKLGFTPREHTEWLGYWDNASSEDRRAGRHGYRTLIHLDFYNEKYRSLFLLKYGSESVAKESM